MNIILVAATELEIKPLIDRFGYVFKLNNHTFEILITGVGMVKTTYLLGRSLQNKSFDLAINIGIAGAFDRSLEIGELVKIQTDLFSELGAEDDDNFLSLIQLGLQEPNEFPFVWGELSAMEGTFSANFENIKSVKAITVNKTHGQLASILFTKKHFNPQIESMEGAAFLYCCLQEKMPCVAIRAISNYVEKRNRDAWNIELAVTTLNENIISILESL